MQKKREEITTKREKTILEKEIDQVLDYLKKINEEVDNSKDYFNIKSSQQNLQQSFNSITQKSMLTKAEENKVINKINLQALFVLEDKENKYDYPMRILRDNINKESESYEGRIGQLLKEMENYKDVLLEFFLCKTNEDRLILDLYLTISKESFTLYSEQDKRMKNYFKTLKEVHYPSDINENLTNINNQYIFIEDISAQNEDFTSKDTTNKINPKDNDELNEDNYNDYDYPFEYENDNDDDSLDSYDSSDKNENYKGENCNRLNENNTSNRNNADDCNISSNSDDICELEEVNVEIKNKLIFNEDKKKTIKLKVQPNDSLYIPSDLKYTQNKKNLDKQKQIGLDNIITIIHSDKNFLPFGLENISIEELTRYIAHLKNTKQEKDLYVEINNPNNRSADSIQNYTEVEDHQKKQNAKCNKYFNTRFIEASELLSEERFTIHEELNKSELNNNQLRIRKLRNKYHLQE